MLKIKVGDKIVDHDCKMKGHRWNGEPLGKGLGPGTVVQVFRDKSFMVQHDHYETPVMYMRNGVRFDRFGKDGSKKIQIIKKSFKIKEKDNQMSKIPKNTTRLDPSDQKVFCPTLNEQQSTRVGNDYFITGAAGTGKSYYINNTLKQDPFGDNTIITSSTGVSAVIVGGFTVHSFFKLGIVNDLEELKERDNALKARDAVGFFRMINSLQRNLKGTRRIVIDEVSMISKDLLDCIHYRLRQGHGEHIQLVYSGDLLQLPPVKGLSVLSHPDFIGIDVMYLQKIYRTKNEEFAKKLSEIRLGNVDIKYLSRFVVDEPVEDNTYTHLVATNNEALYKNAKEYNKINSKEYLFEIKVIEGRFYPSQNELRSMIKNLRIDEVLKLKVGTRVLHTVNNNSLVNGDTGTVIDIDEEGVLVKFDRFEEPKWVSYYTYTKESIIDGKIVLDYNIKYIPLIYAWAITIHKSQGMSIDKLYIDVRNIFAPSQFYVAISRATTPETTKLYFGIEGVDVMNEYIGKMSKVSTKSKRYYEALERSRK